MATTVASLEARFTADTTSFDTGAGNVQNKMQTLGTKVSSLGKNIGAFGQNLTIAMAPAALAIGFATSKAIEFESAFAGVIKTVDATDEELADLRDTIRDMATDETNPVAGLENAHVELAKIMELGGQLGVTTDNLDDFTESIAMLGMSTNLTTEEAAVMAAQFANITGMDISSIDNFGSAIVDLGNNMATNEKDILTFAQRLAGIGTTVGLTETDILALSGTMASLGLKAEAGGTAMTTVLNNMSTAVGSASDELDTFAEVAGLSADDFAAAWEADPVDALNSFLEGLGALDPADQTAALDDLELSGIRVADTLRRMSGNTELLNDALAISETAWADNTALTAEAEARFATTESQMNLLKNKVNEAAITLGDVFIPVLLDIIDTVTPVVEKIGEFVAAHPELVKWVGIGAAALFGLGIAFTVLGPIITAVGGLIGVAGGAIGLIGAFGGLAAVTGALSSAIAFGGTALVGTLALLTSPLTITIGLGIALGVAIFLLKDKILAVADAIWTTVAPAFEWLQSKIQGVLDTLDAAVESAANVAGFDASGVDTGAAIETAVGVATGTGAVDAATDIANTAGSNPLGFAESTINVLGEKLGFAGGTNWTGNMGIGEFAGMVHGQEAVVPHDGMRVIPSPRGLMLEGSVGGGGGRPIYIDRVEVNGVENIEELLDQLQRAARARAA